MSVTSRKPHARPLHAGYGDGKNQVKLVKKSNCLYEGKGLIVKCMSGRKLWKATVLSEKLNNPAFSFDVRD